jgi:hypothetical protein
MGLRFQIKSSKVWKFICGIYKFKSSSTNIAKDLLSMPVRAEKYLSLTTEAVLQCI